MIFKIIFVHSSTIEAFGMWLNQLYNLIKFIIKTDMNAVGFLFVTVFRKETNKLAIKPFSK